MFNYADLDEPTHCILILIETFPHKDRLKDTIKKYKKLLDTKKPVLLALENKNGKLEFQGLDTNDGLLLFLKKQSPAVNQVLWKFHS